MQVIEIDGMVFDEVSEPRAPRSAAPRLEGRTSRQVDARFMSRMESWRNAVQGKHAHNGASQCCAAWARHYVRQRATLMGLLHDDRTEGPRSYPKNSTRAEVDGWLVEAAWRLLGDPNERRVLKALYIYEWPESQLRRYLRGVRGSHVPVLIAKAERNLRSLLITLGDPATIQPTTCLPGCPVPSAELASPWRRRRFV